MSDFIKLNLEASENSKSSTSLSRPEILYIVLEDGDGLKNPENLRYFKKPSPPLDLNLGYEDYIIRDAAFYEANLKILERFLIKNNGRELLQSKNKPKILTSRNVLKLLMVAPYGPVFPKDEFWCVKAVKLGNTICLVKDSETPTVKCKNGTYHLKFQQYCFADTPQGAPIVDIPINENKQTLCVLKTELEDFEILYSAEIAGVESDEEIKNFTDPKTLNQCRFVSTKLLQDNIWNKTWKKDRKILQWWTQAVLGRVDDIYLGFKTANGFVRNEIQHARVDDLPEYQKWKPEVCKGFLHCFLKKMEEVMAKVDNPYQIYEFQFHEVLIHYRKVDVDKSESFLTEEFIQYMQDE